MLGNRTFDLVRQAKCRFVLWPIHDEHGLCS